MRLLHTLSLTLCACSLIPAATINTTVSCGIAYLGLSNTVSNTTACNVTTGNQNYFGDAHANVTYSLTAVNATVNVAAQGLGQMQPRASGSATVQVNYSVETTGPERDGILRLAPQADAGGDDNGGSWGAAVIHVGVAYYGSVNSHDSWFGMTCLSTGCWMDVMLGGTLPIELYATGSAGTSVDNDNTGGGGTASLTYYQFFEADGVTPAASTIVSNVPEPASLSLFLLSATLALLTISLRRSVVPEGSRSRFRKGTR